MKEMKEMKELKKLKQVVRSLRFGMPLRLLYILWCALVVLFIRTPIYLMKEVVTTCREIRKEKRWQKLLKTHGEFTLHPSYFTESPDAESEWKRAWDVNKALEELPLRVQGKYPHPLEEARLAGDRLDINKKELPTDDMLARLKAFKVRTEVFHG